MAEIKMLNELLNACTDFINNIDDFANVQVSTDFECYPTTNEVFISLLASQNSVCEFMATLLERTEIKDISEFTWSLLHEVGHCETWDIMNNRTINHCKYIKRKIRRGSVPTLSYYYLTDERIATDWAIRFVERNYNLVKAFDNSILDLIQQLIIENDLDLTEFGG